MNSDDEVTFRKDETLPFPLQNSDDEVTFRKDETLPFPLQNFIKSKLNTYRTSRRQLAAQKRSLASVPNLSAGSKLSGQLSKNPFIGPIPKFLPGNVYSDIMRAESDTFDKITKEYNTLVEKAHIARKEACISALEAQIQSIESIDMRDSELYKIKSSLKVHADEFSLDAKHLAIMVMNTVSILQHNLRCIRRTLFTVEVNTQSKMEAKKKAALKTTQAISELTLEQKLAAAVKKEVARQLKQSKQTPQKPAPKKTKDPDKKDEKKDKEKKKDKNVKKQKNVRAPRKK